VKNDVKQRILTESMPLIFNNGIKAMTMDELAKRIGVSKRTIYEHFKDKDALLIAILNHYKKIRETQFNKISKESPTVIHIFFNSMPDSAMFSKIVSLHDEIKRYHPAVYSKILHAEEKYETERAKTFFEEGIKQGVFRADLNADITAILFRNCLRQLWSNKEETFDQTYSLEDIFGTFVYVFIRGCCSEKGLKIIDNLH